LLLARRGDLRPEPINTPALLTEIKDILGLSLGASITVELEAAACLPPIFADRAQLETALVNLATNARDAMPEGGTLRLAAMVEEVPPDAPPHPARLKPGHYVRLRVTDTGAGMDADALARVGEPFFTTKGVGKGTGLGLSMVKGFAEQSGGGFAIESAPGRGSTASIWLPVSHIAPEPVRAEPTARHPARILLVDDDPLVLGTVAEQLEDLGHKVLSASGGTDALAILRARQAVDLMITDLAMPGMNGLTLIREAREVQPRLPAILLTGYANELSRLAPQEPNRTVYTLIRKPASTHVLKTRINELLDQD
jgi:CheY-like chemotaxis protein